MTHDLSGFYDTDTLAAQNYSGTYAPDILECICCVVVCVCVSFSLVASRLV